VTTYQLAHMPSGTQLLVRCSGDTQPLPFTLVHLGVSGSVAVVTGTELRHGMRPSVHLIPEALATVRVAEGPAISCPHPYTHPPRQQTRREVPMSKETRRFRVATDRTRTGGMVPWSLGEEVYARHTLLHGTMQSVKRIAERGGFSYSEMLAFGVTRDDLEAALSLDLRAGRCRTCRHWGGTGHWLYETHGEC